MFSKKHFYLLIVSSLVALLSGCGDFLKGKKADPEVIEFADTRFKCLQDVPQQLRKFSVGDANETEIRTSFDCLAEALRYFNKRTFGSVDGSYTSEEMRNFFGKYFLKENNVTPEFAAELMKIKRTLLGGSVSTISKSEIQELISLLGVVRDEFVQLAPHMKTLLLQDSQKSEDWESVSAATEQLRRSSQRLLEKTRIDESDYGFEDAKKALAGFAEFVKGSQPFAPYERYSQWVPAVEAVKNVLMGRRARFTDLQQWQESLNTLLDLYELSLKYHYTLRDLNFENPGKVRQASQFFGQSLRLLKNAHQMKVTGRIPTEDLDNLIDEVLPLMNVEISNKALKKSYRAFLIRALDPDRRGDTRSLLGLERKHLATLEREFNVWRLQQSFIDHLPMGSDRRGMSQEKIYEHFLKFNKNTIIEKGLTEDPFEQKALKNAWQDFGDLLHSPMPLMFNSQGRLVIAADQRQLFSTWKSLTKANLMKTLARALMLGYADNIQEGLQAAQLKKAGLVSWYDDFQELGLDLKAFDPRSANSGARSFLEANFFTFSGNGDDVMDHRETIEFVSTLFSAGLGTSDVLRQHMMASGCAIAEKDVFGFPYLREDCFKKQLLKNFSVFFDNLPGMSRYVGSLTQAQWDKFYNYLVKASEVDQPRAGLIETANIRTMATILHYVEAIIVLYDADKTEGLSLREVYSAAPRFLSFFRTIKPGSPDVLLKEGFAYFVFEGSLPGAADLLGFQASKVWGLKEAQRMEILRLFGSLEDQLSQASPTQK